MMRTRKLLIAITTTVLAAGGIAAGLLLTSTSAQATPMPRLTTIAATTSIPNKFLTMTPMAATEVSAQNTDAATTARSLCAVPDVGPGCWSTAPDSISYVKLTVGYDPTVKDMPIYLLSWTLHGVDCQRGLSGGAIGATITPNPSLLCTYAVGVNPATGKQFITYKTAS